MGNPVSMFTESYSEFFSYKVVFLTGATGGLGGCILYKLALQLPTRRIYVLCRSPETARAKWKTSMPGQYEAIESSGKVVFVVGDIQIENFGIPMTMLQELAENTSIVIHAAASIALWDDVKKAVEINCLPSLELARIVTSFDKLTHFVQISSAYCNSFLPDGIVEERFYDLGVEDLELELANLLRTGTSTFVGRFPFPYAFSKWLMEQLLVRRFPKLPLLIIRPTIIGPAIHQPFTLYGPSGSNPLDTFLYLLMSGSGVAVLRPRQGHASGSNILDEIPVDWVANLTLLHITAGSQGPIHAGAHSYIPRTADELLRILERVDTRHKLDIKFTEDKSENQSPLVSFYTVATRDWRFSGMSSQRFKDLSGPLSIRFNRSDLIVFDTIRLRKIEYNVSLVKRSSKI